MKNLMSNNVYLINNVSDKNKIIRGVQKPKFKT